VQEKGALRRLTTILASDVVGYSRLMAADEAGTLAKLKSHRKELMEPKTAAYHGRVVKLMGDGTLMEFGSVVDAVCFAADVQRAMVARNENVSEDQRITYRIGINIGDIIVEDDDIFGDGVNVAARLEALADPGGICVSAKVYEEVKNKLDLDFEDLGRRHVKNIPEPIRIFRVQLQSRGASSVTAPSRRARRSYSGRMVAVAMAAIVLALAGAALWLRPWEAGFEPASEKRMAFPLPDKPSIVVLPFTNMSEDPRQEYFVDGMTEDLITDLAKISGLFVISRNSAFTYKGRSVEIRQVAEDLGVRYVLEGSARRVGDRVRINAQLIEATTGGHLWAERYDGSLADVFALQDKVTKRIVEALALELMPREARRVGRIGTDNVAAHDAYLLGLSSFYRRTPKDNAKAATHFERAIELDPNYSAAFTALAKAYVQAVIGEQAYAEKLGIFWTDGYTMARRLLEEGMAEPNADFHVLRSWLALRKRQHDRAIAEAEQALELSPNDADALEAMAEALIYVGQPEAGMEFAQRAMRQNPTLLGHPLYLMGLAEFALGNSEKAIEHVEGAMRQAPARKADFSGILAAAYGELGIAEQAKAAFAAFGQGLLNRPTLAWTVYLESAANPRFHTWRRIGLAWSVYSYPFANRAVLDRLASGFKVAGASVGIGGYLPLDAINKLSGTEIESLLFGSEINGNNFWLTESRWRQQRSADGAVEHTGFPIHAGMAKQATGAGRIEDDMLCDQWPLSTTELEICVVIFRVSNPNARIRWGDYVMVTDTGPQPFSLVE
jgi:TolB-like protein/class 3 adenylate cyclase/Flp pilus assembly protein TadD